MSLFNVLKYGNTNLGCEEELEKLPPELLNLYWAKSTVAYIEHANWNVVTDVPEIITYLVNWSNQSRYANEQISAFKEALEEYDEPV